MALNPSNTTNDINKCIDQMIKCKGTNLNIGAPLGIGKPNPLLNSIWSKAKSDSSINLEIFTALSIAVPKANSLLERRFLDPFIKRHFNNKHGSYPDLDYISDVSNNSVPKNMKVTEFYMQSGKMLGSTTAQKNYSSANYTHAARDMVDKGINVIMQMVAVKQTNNGYKFSLSCNPDLTLDILSICSRKNKQRPFMMAMVNPKLPFMAGKAEIEADFFDIILDDESLYHELFAPPLASVNLTDYSIGLLASTLIQDGGTLQVGIGSLADALVYCSKLRHEKNEAYLKLLEKLDIPNKFKKEINSSGSLRPFQQGLYAASEMFVEGFAHLYDAGILKRKVYPDAQIQTLINQHVLTEEIPNNIIEILLEHNILEEVMTKRQLLRLQHLGILNADLKIENGFIVNSNGQSFHTNLHLQKNVQSLQNHCLGNKLKHGVVLHAAFFLGSKWFYQWLRDLAAEKQDQFQMTPVSQINELYGGEVLDRVQRVKARFINTCMKVDLLGAAASDTLANHQVVSGVGGQYNFVAMAHALADSRSILMLRSVHQGKNGPESNIVWSYTYCTIPRHLRDIVITEYGIADLRGQADEECIKRMICIADSRFQNHLRLKAISYNKLDPSWQIPVAFQSNNPTSIINKFSESISSGYFPEYPFGSDFNEQELKIITALKYLKNNTKTKFGLIKLILSSYFSSAKITKYNSFLKRMDLLSTQNMKEKLYQKLLIYALSQTSTNK